MSQSVQHSGGTSASEPMPLPSGSALNGDTLGAGAQSYQTPGNSLHGASPASFGARERGRRDSLGTSMGTPLISPSRSRRDSMGASQGTPMVSPNANGNRRPELGRSDGPRQRTAPRTGRRREPSIPMSQVDDPEAEHSAFQDSEMGEEADDTFVWGTNLSVSSICSSVRRFLQHFKLSPQDEEAKYILLLRQAVKNEAPEMSIDCQDVLSYDAVLYTQLINYPGEVIPLFDSEANLIAQELSGHDVSWTSMDMTLKLKTFNLAESKVIRDLDPSDINKLISVSGMVTRASTVIPDLQIAVFRCESCGNETHVGCDRGRIEEPAACGNCDAKWVMKLLHNRCGFMNKQIIKMQENPNAIPEGETPHAVTLFTYDDLVDGAKPGDRITVTGIYKAAPMRTSPRLRQLKSVYKTYIDVVHICKDETAKLFSTAAAADGSAPAQSAEAAAAQAADPLARGGDLNEEQLAAKEAAFKALGEDPDIYEKLAASLAPSIWQLDDIKKGILCQLFGGCGKEFPGGRVRGELNVLLVGDPGTSKSQIMTAVHKLAPRGIYTSGRGSSAVGLTAYVTRDPETREMVLESGALVLSDQGICCIDEFDKMSDSARSMLHEVMEQQTVSVAKAGIISTLNARTSVLACANPVGSRYNPRLSIIDNIQLPPTLLSRFDLIYLVLDKPNEASDRKLARHLVAMYYDTPPQNLQAVIPLDTLREYIAYARAHCRPRLSEESGAALVDGYVEMRRLGVSRKVITATPRQLESGVRLAEALARMRLSPIVSIEDVQEGLRLMKVALQGSAMDPTTGTIDMDLIQTGISAGARTARAQLTQELRTLIQNSRGGMAITELLTAINGQSSVPVSETELKDALRMLGTEVSINWTARTVKLSEIDG